MCDHEGEERSPNLPKADAALASLKEQLAHADERAQYAEARLTAAESAQASMEAQIAAARRSVATEANEAHEVMTNIREREHASLDAATYVTAQLGTQTLICEDLKAKLDCERRRNSALSDEIIAATQRCIELESQVAKQASQLLDCEAELTLRQTREAHANASIAVIDDGIGKTGSDVGCNLVTTTECVGANLDSNQPVARVAELEATLEAMRRAVVKRTVQLREQQHDEAQRWIGAASKAWSKMGDNVVRTKSLECRRRCFHALQQHAVARRMERLASAAAAREQDASASVLARAHMQAEAKAAVAAVTSMLAEIELEAANSDFALQRRLDIGALSMPQVCHTHSFT